MTLNKASPTASRQARLWLLTLTKWNSWQLICADVKAAFLSGSNFDRVIIVRLPADCGPLLGVNLEGISKHVFMRLKKSAYGLSDAPLLWYQEASRRLTEMGWIKHPMDQCCFMLVANDKHSSHGSLRGMMILHVDDVLVTGCPTDSFSGRSQKPATAVQLWKMGCFDPNTFLEILWRHHCPE